MISAAFRPLRSWPLRHHVQARGFTLVITLTLMILLAILCVGLLSLSAISLRQANSQSATAEARANARLALMLALGDLQKLLGPDRAITAPADIVLPEGGEGRKYLTGAWESWAIDPAEGEPNYVGEKEKRFRQWLVSDSRIKERGKLDYPTMQAADPITLVSAQNDPSASIIADRVQVANRGAFAWHVADEATKARIDVLRDPEPAQKLADKRALVAGHRPGVRAITSGTTFKFSDLPGDLTPQEFAQGQPVMAKLIDLEQAELVGGQMPPELRQEITTHSIGVLCDARNGGLKKDLSFAFAMPGGLPKELAGKRLYASTHGFSGVSDPYWSTLSGFYNTFTELVGDTPPIYKVNQVDTLRMDRESVPRNYTLAPVIQKFDAMFTIVARDNHTPVSNTTQNPVSVHPTWKYLLYLVYVPVVTLHNPYNVEIEFERLNLLVRDLPVAFNVFVNDEPQNNDFVPFNEMWVGTGPKDSGRGAKTARLDLANWQYHNESRPSMPVRMKPGQTLFFGPYMDPSATSKDTIRGNMIGDVDTDAKALKLRPGFIGKSVGYAWDWLAPDRYRSPNARWPKWGTMPLAWDDRVRLEMAVRQPEMGVTDQWDLSAELYVRNRPVSYGGMRFVYRDQETLTKYFPEIIHYPQRGSEKTSNMYEPYAKLLKDQVRGKAVTSFSCTARTANGGVYENNSRDLVPGGVNTLRDGRLAGKPFLHHNPARNAIVVDLKQDIVGRHSHELNFQPLKGELDDVIELDALNRGAGLTGNTTIKGIKSGALFDIPSGPLQTLAGFRRSNALSSTYLPHPVQPLANSWVHPMMSTTEVRQDGVTSYPLLDHSYLANTALYDGFYFSTFAPRGDTSAKEAFQEFFQNGKPLLSQCFLPWHPDGTSTERGTSSLFAASDPTADAWLQASSWEMVKGPFNVNSTSVLAWKAMLTSLANTQIPVLWAKSLALESVGDPSDIAVPSFTMPLAGRAGVAQIDPKKIDNVRANDWNGYHTLDPTELEVLATRIVEEVRARGPFLSMAEFVNRRIGYNSDLTRVGALQAAIDKSKVNNRLFSDIEPVRLTDVSDPAIYAYQTPEMELGNPAEGAPGTICQGDILHLLEPRATVRGDTFVIRAAGQALDANGNALATAYAEAVVQRVPDFIDPANPAATPLKDLNPTNLMFGRRMKIVSFRWLSTNEI